MKKYVSLAENDKISLDVLPQHTHSLADIYDFTVSKEILKQLRFDITYNTVNYIQSNGSGYIDTGFKPNQDTRVIATVSLDHDSDNEFLFGARKAVGENTYCFSNYDNSKCRTHYNTTYLDFDITHGTPFDIDKNKNITTIANGTGVIEHDYATFSCPVNMYIFCVNTNGSKANYSTAKLYSMKIYDNDVLVRDFIPVYHIFHEEYGLYDKVNDIFYRNQGSGSFSGE